MIRNGDIRNYMELERHPVGEDRGSHEIELKGCSPVPLAHYLKALGIMKIVSSQIEYDVLGYWKNESFYLNLSYDKNELVDFFRDRYSPTPVVSPWNGGSGFSTDDYTDAIERIYASSQERFGDYRNSIEKGRKARKQLGIEKKVSKDQKEIILTLCRNIFPDRALEWLDAAFVLTDSGARYPPLLGTGGNDGRLDFSNNFMKNLVSMIIDTENEVSVELLRNSLFDHQINDLTKSAIGQFFPHAAGGANAVAGFDSDSKINPWDFIFMIEGALLFAASCSRKHQETGSNALSYPFSVRSTSAGYGTSSNNDESNSRPEIWMPIWNEGISLDELKRILSEGRASLGKKQSVDGLDFARSIAQLGVDRGINEFQRYGFQVRNGLAYFATPIGRFKVERKPDADLLMEIDQWMGRFRYHSTKEEAPASFKRAANNLDRSILDICKKEGPHIVQNLLVDLGKCERTMVNSFGWTEKSKLKPIPPLSSKWLEKSDDGSVEFRLAASLASLYGKYGDRFIPFRYNIEPINRSIVDESANKVWWKEEGNKDFVPTKGDIFRVLNSIMERRIITASQSNVDSYPDHGKITAYLGDISDFLEGRCNYNKLMDLLWGLILLNWVSISREKVSLTRRDPGDSVLPGADYSVMKLCHHRWYGEDADEIPLDPQIHRKASRGEGGKAIEFAIRRLRGSGVVPAVDSFPVSSERSIRIAASLLFPIDKYNAKRIRDNVTRPNENKKEE